MKKVIIATLTMLSCVIPTFAALSPMYQSVKEINAILSSPELDSLNQSYDIEKIIRIENGYLILNQEQKLFVEVIYEPSSGPGPQKFTLHFYPVKANRRFN